MTHLQVQYNQLREAERTNRESEAIKRREARVKEREIGLATEKLPYEIQRIVSQANLDAAKINEIATSIDQMKAKIKEINANTALTVEQKNLEAIKVANANIDMLHRLTGISPVGDMEDWILDTIQGLLGSKAGSTAVVGALVG